MYCQSIETEKLCYCCSINNLKFLQETIDSLRLSLFPILFLPFSFVLVKNKLCGHFCMPHPFLRLCRIAGIHYLFFRVGEERKVRKKKAKLRKLLFTVLVSCHLFVELNYNKFVLLFILSLSVYLMMIGEPRFA